MMAAKPPRSRHSAPTDSTGWVLWRATLSWQRQIRAALTPLSLTHAQFVILAATWWLTSENGRHPTQRELAEHAGTDAMTTSQVVRRLQSMRHLERHADPADRRVWRLSLTPEGAELLAHALPAVEAIDTAFFEPLSDEQTHWRSQLLSLIGEGPPRGLPHI